MRKCTVCGDSFLGEEISEWRADHEPYSQNPFICPDCYDRELAHRDLEDQLNRLMVGTGTTLKRTTLGT